MSEAGGILYAVEAGVATITFNRPEKLNAMTPPMLEQVFAYFAEAGADPSVRVILLTGAGRGFCAGLDLQVIGAGASGEADLSRKIAPQWGDEVGPALARFYNEGWGALISCRKPTIAAINGPAFGWGFILALHCDIRFAARSALFNATFARLGVPAEKNSGWLLTRLIGIARTADLVYTARRFDGVEAERLGIVNAVLDDDKLAAHANAYARDIAANSAPRALAAMKAQIWAALDDPYDVAFADSDREQAICAASADFREGLQSYVQKRPPAFTGR